MFVHVRQRGPHTRQLLALRLLHRQIRKARALDAKSRPHNVQRIRHRHARNTGQSATQQPLEWTPRQIVPRNVLKEALVQVVAPKLHGAIWYDSDAIRSIARHEAAPALLTPHLSERLADTQLVLRAAGGLDLEEDFQTFEGRDDGARDRASYAAGAKGR